MMEARRVNDIYAQWRARAEEWERLPPQEKEKRLLQQVRAEADEFQLKRAEKIERRLGVVEPRFRGAQVSHPKVNDWLEHFMSGGDRGLLLCGPTNAGKSHLLWGIYRAVALAEGPEVEYVRLVRLLSQLRPGGDVGSDYVSRLCKIPLLLIDDLGAQKDSQWVDERLYEIVDMRYAYLKPMVVCSNLRPENLKAQIGERVARRLLDTCDLLVLEKR